MRSPEIGKTLGRVNAFGNSEEAANILNQKKSDGWTTPRWVPIVFGLLVAALAYGGWLLFDAERRDAGIDGEDRQSACLDRLRSNVFDDLDAAVRVRPLSVVARQLGRGDVEEIRLDAARLSHVGEYDADGALLRVHEAPRASAAEFPDQLSVDHMSRMQDAALGYAAELIPGDRTAYMATPFYSGPHGSRQRAGYAAIRIDVGAVERIVEERAEHCGPLASVLVADHEQRIIVRSSLAPDSVAAALSQAISATSVGGRELSIEFESEVDGSMVGSFERDEASGWVFVVQQPWTAVYAPLINLGLKMLFGLGLLVAGFVFVLRKRRWYARG